MGNSENPPLPGSFPMLGHQNSPKKATGQYSIRLQISFHYDSDKTYKQMMGT